MECERVHGVEMYGKGLALTPRAIVTSGFIFWGREMVGKRGGAGPSAIERV